MRSAPSRRRVARRLWLRAMSTVLLATLFGTAPRALDADRAAQAAQRLGPRAVQGLRQLHGVLAGLAAVDDAAKLEAVNQFFNRRIVFRDDQEVWHTDDYWASPLETLSQGMGDCEDFAIAKYFSLLAVGVPASRLRLVYVRLQLGGPGGPSR
jgi:predicted transglutaminase-like cysteine proteinase